ncbi:hypothetical protein ACTJJB_01580 [Chitinophaga sp. 22536]|uniref:hypothetical protein n=1 Tax=unclassified Chitinophaga TaxID=2619133 RepID=UPI003F85338E
MSLVINDTQYAGTFASYFWIPATYGMDSIRKGAVYVQDGIKKQHTIGRVDFSNPLQPRQAVPQSAGQFTIDGRTLIPQDVMLYTEFNPRDFETHWLAEQLSPTLLARELPVTAENYMLQMALNRSVEQLENGVWMGSKAYAGAVDPTDPRYQLQFWDGFLVKFLADATVKKVANPGVLVAGTTGGGNTNIADAFDGLLSLTASNKKALLANPKRYERLKFFVSINTEQVYQTFLTTSQTFKGVNTTDRGINLYKGYEVVPLAGMPDNTIVFTEGLPDTDSNLYVGMNSTEDNQLQLMRLQNNAELFFIKGLMKYDVEYGFSDQVFLYTTLTQANFQP